MIQGTAQANFSTGPSDIFPRLAFLLPAANKSEGEQKIKQVNKLLNRAMPLPRDRILEVNSEISEVTHSCCQQPKVLALPEEPKAGCDNQLCA